MAKKQSKRQRDIKTKLMAAICMLLVSSIMMVSSTYAWFTLSTAPEVTGINTAVGANGNLEMALLPKDGQLTSITSAAGDGVLAQEERNVTWGNLVNLAVENNQSVYGLDKITLFPAELSLTKAGKVNVGASILKTPQYGADGRITQLADNSATGYFDKQTQTFSPNDFYGVRAVGTASGMTDRQLSYRNARSAANTAMALAANLASQSLNNNGSSLANIAIKYGMDGAAATFGKAEVESLRTIINDLKGEGGVMDQIETAYMQYILAMAASAATGTEDTAWNSVKTLVEASNATLASVQAGLPASVELPEELRNAIDAFGVTKDKVTSADSKLQNLEGRLATDATATFTWAEIKEAMEPLADPTAMEINGFKASEVKSKLGDLVSSVTAQGGLKVIMKTVFDNPDTTEVNETSSGGVYAEVADHCGDYTASVTIERVEYQGIVLNNMAARMETKSGLAPNYYLVAIGATIAGLGAPASGAEGSLPITDMYGYIIDLAFRTNAAESNLLLQQDATDRIYGDDNSNENTMGHGASMTFMATTTDFSNDQVKTLMSAIELVFFDPKDGTVYCYGKLDTATATAGTDGITAKIVLFKKVAGATTYNPATYTQGSGLTYYTKTTEDVWTETTDISDKTLVYYVKTGETYAKVEDNTTLVEGTTYYHHSTKDVYSTVTDEQASQAAAGTLYIANKAQDSTQNITDNVIMPLTQNQAQALSVLVYLDGNKVTNGSVAATGSTSMTGKMNLQFASSANLVPMEYADLHIPGSNTETNTPTTYDVSASADGVTLSNAKAEANKAYTFTLKDGYTLDSITVGGTTLTANTDYTVTDSTVTINADKVTGAIVINVTQN